MTAQCSVFTYVFRCVEDEGHEGEHHSYTVDGIDFGFTEDGDVWRVTYDFDQRKWVPL